MVEITNQMFVDEYSNAMTRCFQPMKKKVKGKIVTVMSIYVVPTDPSQIRRQYSVDAKLNKPPSDTRRESTGATSGWKQK